MLDFLHKAIYVIVKDKLSWYFHRLNKMPKAEILHRLHHKVNQHLDECCPFLTVPAVPDHSFIDTDLLTRLSCHAGPLEIGLWQKQLPVPLLTMADRILANSFDVFGIDVQHGDAVNWHQDAKTGRLWPLKFWSKVNIRDGATIGGVKFVWEINRLYCLPILGMVYRCTGKERYAKAIFSMVRSWSEANPYPLGVNWTSGIELGLRVANLIWSLSFLEGYEVKPEERTCVLGFLQLHGYHLYRYQSKYSSNNNHALAEALGLFLASVFFSGLKGAASWRDFGKKILEREVTRQIFADGGSYEYTTSYLSFTADFFLLYRMVCVRLNLTYDPVIDERLESSCEYLANLIDSRGNLPNIGDQDSAVLVNFGLDNHANFRSLLNTCAMLYGRAEFRQEGELDFKTALLLGESGQGKQSSQPNNAHALMEQSGLSVIRVSGSNKELVFVGNATPLGMPPLYAHGHLDALSFTLSVDGQEVFVDPGTYLYHSGGKWRTYFRSVAAHNTVRVNKTEFTDQPGPFMFGRPYAITKHTLLRENKSIAWQASHDAYLQLKEPVHLYRQVRYDTDTEKFAIDDTLRSNGEYFVEQFFHLHPDCQVELQGQEAVILVGETTRVMVSFDRKVQIKQYKGSDDPLAGWFSPTFNRLQQCSTIVASGQQSGLSVLQTEIDVIRDAGNIV